jgi:hypothetical protein
LQFKLLDSKKTGLIIVLLGFILVNLMELYVHSPAKYVGWESQQYLANANAFVEQSTPAGAMPSVTRIGIPYVAAQLGVNNVDGFLYLNVLANLLCSVLTYFWLSRWLKPGIAAALIVAFSFHWLGNVRFTYWAPVNPDPWAAVFLVIGLILIDRKYSSGQLILIALISLFGVMIRESLVVIPIAYGVRCFAIKGKHWQLAAGTPLLFAVLGLWIARSSVNITGDIGLLQTMYHWAFEKPWPVVLLGFFMAFGVATLLAFSLRTKEHIKSNPEHLVVVIVLGIAAWLGGTDTERIFLWTSPIVLIWIGYGLGTNRHATTLALLASILTLRLFLDTPNYPGSGADAIRLLTPLSSTIQYTELLSYHMMRESAATLIMQYILVVAIVAYLLVARLGIARASTERKWAANG